MYAMHKYRHAKFECQNATLGTIILLKWTGKMESLVDKLVQAKEPQDKCQTKRRIGAKGVEQLGL